MRRDVEKREPQIEVLPPEDSRNDDLERLAALLDSAFVIPGTGLRLGIDSLLGLVPGVGDALGAAFASYFIYRGARAGLPRALLLRMLANVALDAVAGFVPIVGDVFDLAFKANQRNARLMLQHLAQHRPRVERSPEQVAHLMLWLMIGLLLLCAAGIIGLVAGLLKIL